MKRLLTASLMVALCTVSATGALGQSAKTLLKETAQAELFNDVSDRLVCQCSCMMIVRVCNHQNCPSAIPIRREIERQILEGKGEDEIVASFVEEYGMKVLSAPPAEGINLAAWIMPGFAVLIGLLVAMHVAGRWAARHKLAAAGPAVEIDPSTRERVKAELDNMEH